MSADPYAVTVIVLDPGRCACPACRCDYRLDDYRPGDRVCGACLDVCVVTS